MTGELTAVLVPHPPLLFRELGGAADPVADLRAACLEALRDALTPAPDTVLVVGPTDHPGPVAADLRPDVRRFGTTGERTAPGLPLSLGVGRRLLEDAGWSGPTELVGLALDAPDADLRTLVGEIAARPGRILVLLLGDGSARRDEKGPGTLDERAFGFDAEVVRALREGDAAALAGLDVDLARDLMVLGRSSFRLLGSLGAATTPVRAAVHHESDPYGVLYVAATWSW